MCCVLCGLLIVVGCSRWVVVLVLVVWCLLFGVCSVLCVLFVVRRSSLYVFRCVLFVGRCSLFVVCYWLYGVCCLSFLDCRLLCQLLCAV